jgi:hypothetical protein
MIKYVEGSNEYATDIELFSKYWESLGNLNIYETIDILEKKMAEPECQNINFARTYSIENFWEKAKTNVFYEDVRFVLESLKTLEKKEKIVYIQCPEYPNKVVREKKLITLISKKYGY